MFGTKPLLFGLAAAAVIGGVIGGLELPRNTGNAVAMAGIVAILVALAVHAKLTTGTVPGGRSNR